MSKTAPIARTIPRLWHGEIQFADFISFGDINLNDPTEESLDDQIQSNQILAPSMTYEEI